LVPFTFTFRKRDLIEIIKIKPLQVIKEREKENLSSNSGGGEAV